MGDLLSSGGRSLGSVSTPLCPCDPIQGVYYSGSDSFKSFEAIQTSDWRKNPADHFSSTFQIDIQHLQYHNTGVD